MEEIGTMKNFVEMVNKKIEEENLLTICMKHGVIQIINSIIPDNINTDNGIHIKGEWLSLDISADCEITYDEFDDEFAIKCSDGTLYFS